MKRKFLLLSVIFGLLITLPPVAPANNLKGISIGGVTMVPIRVISETFGQQISWDEGNKTVQLGTTLPTTFKENSFEAVINGVTKNSPVPVIRYHDSIYVPLRIFAEALGATVSWNPTENAAIIYYQTDILKILVDELSPDYKKQILRTAAINISSDNILLEAVKPICNDFYGSGDNLVINYFKFNIVDSNPYFIFIVETINMGADGFFVILKFENGTWEKCFEGTYFDPEIPGDKYWQLVDYNSFDYINLPESIILDTKNGTVYFCSLKDKVIY